jgi:hypothetical protein
MKEAFTGLKLFGALALLALAIGCESYQGRTTESLLTQAGFQARTPSSQAQLAICLVQLRLHQKPFPTRSSLIKYVSKQVTYQESP